MSILSMLKAKKIILYAKRNPKWGELNQDNKELKTYGVLTFGTGVVTSKLGVDDLLPPS